MILWAIKTESLPSEWASRHRYKLPICFKATHWIEARDLARGYFGEDVPNSAEWECYEPGPGDCLPYVRIYPDDFLIEYQLDTLKP